MEKLNIAELLKDCPTGMELDSTLFEGLEFDCIVDNEYLPIRCRIKHPNGGYTVYNFTKYGCWLDTTFAKCVIFPKGKTTWEGFQRPFKDGDVVASDSSGWLGIIKNKYNTEYYTIHCALDGTFHYKFLTKGEYCFSRFATEEEKQKLFDAIKANGYKWNQDTKTLEKLEVSKFDITTLKPFGSRVLVRSTNDDIWRPAIYGFTDSDRYYIVGGIYWKQCLPYLNNEHLCGTTKDCDEYYKTWE